MWLCLYLHMKEKDAEALHGNDGMRTHDYKGQQQTRTAEKKKKKKGRLSFSLAFFITISESLKINELVELVGAFVGPTEQDNTVFLLCLFSLKIDLENF